MGSHLHRGLTVLAALALARAVPAAPVPPAGFVADSVGGSFTDAVGIVGLDDGRAIAWERSGLLWMIRADGTRVPSPILDIRPEVGAWRDHGLLGVALHPAFPAVAEVFLLYVVDRHHLLHVGTPSYDPSRDEYFAATIGRITRYALDPGQDLCATIPGSRRVLVGETQSAGLPVCHQSHAVGSLLFGQDGTLLASMGDSASYVETDLGGQVTGGWVDQAIADGILSPKEDVGAFRSQLVDSLCGKILRIDPSTGDGVPGNPWFDPAFPRAPRSRAWALGLRNPYRMSLVPGTGSHRPEDADPGSILVGDVGWGVWEEVSLVRGPGENLGWPVFEGQDFHPSYASAATVNPDSGVGGCPAVPFRELIRQDSTAPSSIVRSCAVFQAEGAAASGVPTLSNEFGFTGSGYRDFPEGSSTWIEWTVELPAAATQALSFRYANGGSSDRPLAVLVDGVEVVASLPFPSTGGWRDWRTAVTPPVPLAAGTRKIRLRPAAGNGPNIDAMWLGPAPSYPPSVATFTHRRPVVEWKHGSASASSARTPGLTAEGAASFLAVGSPGGAAGAPFSGYCAIGGPRLNMPSWPEEWQGAMLLADYSSGWIRAARTLKARSCGAASVACRCELTVTEVVPFDSGLADVVGVFAHPQAGAVYVARMGAISRYRWLPAGTQPPVARIAAALRHGPSPFTLHVDASGSSDPEGAPLTYSWDFGDGSAPVAGPIASHTYVAAGPAGFDVTLTARDPGGAESTARIRVAVNDSPPVARIASVWDGQLYPMDGDTPFVLRADVAEEVSGPDSVECSWQVSLHHDGHVHPEPPVDDCSATAVISPIGCAPPSVYWYEVSLTVTDPSGLQSHDSVRLFPDCEGRLRCTGDIDGDGQVSGGDLAEVLSWWQGGGPADIDRDGFVGGSDLAEVLSRWGACPP